MQGWEVFVRQRLWDLGRLRRKGRDCPAHVNGYKKDVLWLQLHYQFEAPSPLCTSSFIQPLHPVYQNGQSRAISQASQIGHCGSAQLRTNSAMHSESGMSFRGSLISRHFVLPFRPCLHPLLPARKLRKPRPLPVLHSNSKRLLSVSAKVLSPRLNCHLLCAVLFLTLSTCFSVSNFGL